MAELNLTLNVNESPCKGSRIVLVVDDFQEIREGLSSVLNQHGYETVEASNAREAKFLFEILPVELVVTDIYMPEKDGLQLIGELRKFDPNAKIIAMSGGGGPHFPECLEQAKGLGASKTLTKPFDQINFVEMVHAVIHAS